LKTQVHANGSAFTHSHDVESSIPQSMDIEVRPGKVLKVGPTHKAEYQDARSWLQENTRR
jgi:hypothetical protein